MQQNIKDEQQNKDATEVVTDHVCGMTKPKSEMKEASVFLEKNYYFCSKGDRELFDAHPAIVKGISAAFILLSVYFVIISWVSGWNFALDQFSQFWYFIVTLAVGFGIQVGLYSYLKTKTSGKVLAVSGATSTTAMVSCCAHYLANLLPILGAIGIITVISQYQIQLFWVGLAFNFAGLAYMLYQFIKLKLDQSP